jgi:hypothetical protein
MSHPFTPAQLRLLAIADQVEDQETKREKANRQSVESRARRRARMGEVAYKALMTEMALARDARRRDLAAHRPRRTG